MDKTHKVFCLYCELHKTSDATLFRNVKREKKEYFEKKRLISPEMLENVKKCLKKAKKNHPERWFFG